MTLSTSHVERKIRPNACAQRVTIFAYVTLALWMSLGHLSAVAENVHPSDIKRNSMEAVAHKIAEFKEEDDVASLAFNPDSSQLAVGTFTTLNVHLWVWQGSSHIARTLLKPHGTADYLSGNGLRYSPDGRLLAVTHSLARDADGSGVVRIFNPASGEVVHSIAEPLGGGDRSEIEFSPDGRTLLRLYSNSTKTGNQFIVHRVDTWEAVWGLTILPLSGMSLAVSPHGDMAAIGGITLGPGVVHNAQILIIDLTSRRITRTIDNAFPQENQVEQLAWSADGAHIAASGIVGGTYSIPDAVRIFDVATGAQVAGEPINPAHGFGLRYTRDGKYLIECGIAQTVRIWDAQHKALLQTIPAAHAYAIAVSRDGNYLAVGDGMRVTVWQLT
jgi:WD40 repeat protein